MSFASPLLRRWLPRSGAVLALFLSALVCPPTASAQRGGADRLPADSQVVIGQLPNGLRYYIRENREPAARAELRLAVNAGSVLEDRDQLGLAHFLEHMAFNGTRSFEKQELVDYLESVGMRFGPDINAYTSYDETVYMLTLPTDTAGVLETGFQILEEWASAISLDSVEVEKERGVVIEEWRLGQGAGSRMQREQLPILMRRSRYAQRDPIGSLESLRTFDHDALRRFYRDWYRPELMSVVAVGDFDAREVELLIWMHFGNLQNPRGAPERREYRVPDHRETLVSVATDPEATAATVSLYLKRRPRPMETERAYRGWIVESLASSMLTNRLSETTQRPNAPFLDVSTFHGRFIRPLAAHVLSVRVPDDGVERGTEALLTEVERAAQHGFTATELEREKRETLRRMEQRFVERANNTSSSYAAEYVSHYLYGGIPIDMAVEYDLYRRLLPEITADEVSAQAREWLRARNRVVLVRAPERDGLVVPEAERLTRVVREVHRRPLPAYTDSLSQAPLVSSPPTPGRIVAERSIPEVGVTEWELSNGVRVLLKPTDFREEEVLLAARSPGGTSLVPDADYVAALTAPAVVQVGGVGQLSANELRKRLAGKVAGVGADIGELHEGMSGAAAPRDLETLLQLVYLKFTAPRVDTAAFVAYQAQARASLANRSANPETVWLDSLRVTLAQYHPRARPPSSAMFDSLDLHRSFEIYRERFADASDFTFYLVGNLDLDSLRPLVELYLGGLPSLNRSEQGRDTGIRPPEGVVRKQVFEGMEPKARTQIVFSGDFDFSRESVYLLDALEEVVRLRLREALREDMGGTYGVEVRGAGGRDPWPRYQFSVGFGADPERLDELTGAAFAQLDSLRTHGPDPDDLAKVREMQLRTRQTEMRRNHFWIAQLLSFDRLGWDLRDIHAYEQWLAALTPEQLQAAAARYLDPASYVQVSLLPESARAPLASGAEGGTELP